MRAGFRSRLTADEVIAFVHAQVAHYKRVRHVGFIDAIPKSASGKILRGVLVERERGAVSDPRRVHDLWFETRRLEEHRSLSEGLFLGAVLVSRRARAWLPNGH
jgi:hypothetical protein